MKRWALPFVIRVYGLVRFCVRLSTEQAFLQGLER